MLEPIAKDKIYDKIITPKEEEPGEDGEEPEEKEEEEKGEEVHPPTSSLHVYMLWASPLGGVFMFPVGFVAPWYEFQPQASISTRKPHFVLQISWPLQSGAGISAENFTLLALVYLSIRKAPLLVCLRTWA